MCQGLCTALVEPSELTASRIAFRHRVRVAVHRFPLIIMSIRKDDDEAAPGRVEDRCAFTLGPVPISIPAFIGLGDGQRPRSCLAARTPLGRSKEGSSRIAPGSPGDQGGFP